MLSLLLLLLAHQLNPNMTRIGKKEFWVTSLVHKWKIDWQLTNHLSHLLLHVVVVGRCVGRRTSHLLVRGLALLASCWIAPWSRKEAKKPLFMGLEVTHASGHWWLTKALAKWEDSAEPRQVFWGSWWQPKRAKGLDLPIPQKFETHFRTIIVQSKTE